jgi:hypothetical protein
MACSICLLGLEIVSTRKGASEEASSTLRRVHNILLEKKVAKNEQRNKEMRAQVQQVGRIT